MKLAQILGEQLSQQDKDDLLEIFVDEIGGDYDDDDEMTANVIKAVRASHNINLRRMSDADIKIELQKYIDENATDWQ